jgi:hypothetical protein
LLATTVAIVCGNVPGHGMGLRSGLRRSGQIRCREPLDPAEAGRLCGEGRSSIPRSGLSILGEGGGHVMQVFSPWCEEFDIEVTRIVSKSRNESVGSVKGHLRLG